MARLLTTAEMAKEKHISEYELRKGAKEGRYPVVMLGSPSSKFRKMRWNPDVFDEVMQRNSIQRQQEQAARSV